MTRATSSPGRYTIGVDCKTNGTEVAGYPQDVTFDTGGSQELKGIPIGAACTVAEPDAQGATLTATAYDPDTNGSAVISGTTVAVASVTNTYDPAILTVSKTVVGPGPPGPYNFSDTCELTSTAGTVPVQLPAAEASFALSSGEDHATTVPIGALCTVNEVDAPPGDTVTYDGQTTPPTLTMTADTTLAVTNMFAAPPPPSVTTTTVPPTTTTISTTTTTTAPTSPQRRQQRHPRPRRRRRRPADRPTTPTATTTPTSPTTKPAVPSTTSTTKPSIPTTQPSVPTKPKTPTTRTPVPTTKPIVPTTPTTKPSTPTTTPATPTTKPPTPPAAATTSTTKPSTQPSQTSSRSAP